MFQSFISTFVITSLLSLSGTECRNTRNRTVPGKIPGHNDALDQTIIDIDSQNVTDTPSTMDHCLNLENLPKDVFDVISKFSGTADMINLVSTNKIIHEACQNTMKNRTDMYYVGNIPTFIPAMKRCMMTDDVKCFRVVMKRFQSQNEVKPWRVKQLPALAAQLGALRIFQELNVTEAHPNWTSWMTRALAVGHDKILDQQAPKFYNSLKRWYRVQYFRPEFLYHVQSIGWTKELFVAPQKMSTTYDPSRCEPFQYRHGTLGERVSKILEGNEKVGWINQTMMKPDQYPNVKEVFQILKLEDVSQRRDKILELKSRILSVLNQGIYLLDDMIEYSANLHVLWQHFGTKKESTRKNGNGTLAQEDDGGRSSFIQWLMDEGAPMTVNDWLTIYFNSKTKTSMELEWINLCSKYVSGSSTATLSFRLKTHIREMSPGQDASILDELPFFKDVLGADLYDMSVMQSVIQLLGIQSNPKRSQHLTWYAENGLTMSHLELYRAYYESLPESTRQLKFKPVFLDVISELEKALKGGSLSLKKEKGKEPLGQ